MGHEVDPSSPSGAGIKNKGSHTSAHPTYLHDRGNFYLRKGDQNLQQGL